MLLVKLKLRVAGVDGGHYHSAGYMGLMSKDTMQTLQGRQIGSMIRFGNEKAGLANPSVARASGNAGASGGGGTAAGGRSGGGGGGGNAVIASVPDSEGEKLFVQIDFSAVGIGEKHFHEASYEGVMSYRGMQELQGRQLGDIVNMGYEQSGSTNRA